MALLDFFRRRKSAAPILRSPGAQATWSAVGPKVRAQSGWMAAQPSRLLADLPGGHGFAPNRDIRWQLDTLRNRSRWLAQNEGYTAGFLKSLRRNVVGPKGFTLQMQVMNDRGTGKDENANQRIESGFAQWARRGVCDVTGRHSWLDMCGLVVLGVARDGEALIRLHKGGNPFGFQIEMLDPSQLETDVNGRPEGTASGNVVRAGVELTPFNRPAAYWMRAHVPNDDPAALNVPLRQRVRIPAEEMLHLFLPEWPQQIRGVPWISNGIRALAMLDGYGEAELTAARVAAAKMGFYRIDADAEPDGELADDGALVQEASAGTFELLPKGVDFQQFDPQHPTTAFKEFVSAMLRPVAAGAGVSYNAFANDAEGMNYSALRATELEDRDEFRTLQHWMISGLCQPVFTAWLREALITGALGLPAGKMWKFDAPNFVPRGWQWVDPLKEVAAVEKAVALGISSRTATVAAQGGDFAETIAELKAEKALMGDLIPPAAAPAAPAEPDADDED
jgi:lambda family phage portal protein